MRHVRRVRADGSKGRWALGALLVFGMLGCRESTGLASPVSEPTRIPGPDDVVARIHGEPILRSEIDPAEPASLYRHGPGGKLMARIFWPLYRELIEEHGLQATEQEIDGYIESLESSNEERIGNPLPETGSKEPPDMAHRLGTYFVTQWKADRLLVERYGGRVMFQQLQPLEPTGAYLAFLEDHQARGTFEILDPELVPGFWAYLKRPGRSRPSEDFDFSTPWWRWPAKR